MNKLIWITLVWSTVFAADYLTKQPNWLPACQINSKEFIKCSTNSIQQLFKQLKIGIPGLKTLGPIDPFPVTRIRLDQDNNMAVTLKADFTKVNVNGMGDAIVTKSNVSKQDYSWETKFRIPKLRLASDYKMNGRILLIRLKGTGKFFMETENLDVIMYTTTRLYEKGQFTFYNVTDVRVDLKVSKLKLKMTNLFNGNTELEESVHQLFNENWRDLYQSLEPVIKQTVESIMLSVLQRVFHYIPANFFVTDIPSSKELYG